MARRAELNPEQLSTNDFTTVDTIHKKDCDWYHQKCKGEMVIDEREEFLTAKASVCATCGLIVRSTLSDVHTWRQRDA